MIFTERLGPLDIGQAAVLLKKGNVIAFPTETVYGLGAPIFNPVAVQKIFTLKGRPADNPLIAHIADFEQLKQIAVDIPPGFYSLAAIFFPGPLTVILKKHPRVPSIVSGGLDTIAVRMPRHPIAQQLILTMGEPLVAPSANLSGKPSSTLCDHVLQDFDGRIAAVIDGGKTELGMESTVVSLLHSPPLLLRPGSITKEEIEKVIGQISEGDSHEKVLSPGMKYRHYCPKTPIRTFTSQEELLDAAENEKRPLILTRFTAFPREDHYTLCAKDLYALLRHADTQGYSSIFILLDEALLQDGALKNRLFRACGVL